MNTLAQQITAAGLTGTAAEVRTLLGQTVHLPYNSERWSYSGVATTYGTAVAEALYAAIGAAKGPGAAATYINPGIDLSLDESQDGLAAIAAAVPALAAVCNALRAIGRPTAPRWEQLGLPSLPGDADVQAALDEIADEPAAVFDQRRVLLSFNRGATDALVIRVQAATNDGRLGNVLSTIATSDAAAAELTEAERSLVDAIRAAVDAFVEAV